MTIREELRLCAASEKPLSGLTACIVIWGFCSPREFINRLSRDEKSTFLLLIAEAL